MLNVRKNSCIPVITCIIEEMGEKRISAPKINVEQTRIVSQYLLSSLLYSSFIRSPRSSSHLSSHLWFIPASLSDAIFTFSTSSQLSSHLPLLSGSRASICFPNEKMSCLSDVVLLEVGWLLCESLLFIHMLCVCACVRALGCVCVCECVRLKG